MLIEPHVISEIVGGVPSYDKYPTVAEMRSWAEEFASRHSGVVERRAWGTSREGLPLETLSIGQGARNILLVACPHPNEPIGMLVVQYLAERLARDSALRRAFDWTWHFVPCIDPDGTRLNEGWFNGPFTIPHYARNFYRPPMDDQVEWTFPISYKNLEFNKPLPETRAWIGMIERIMPDFLYSLHNCGFGGVYYYLSRPSGHLVDRLGSLAGEMDLPLALGEPEVFWAPVLGRAVFGSLSVRNWYDYLEKYTPDPLTFIRCGGSSWDFLSERNPKAFHLLCEVPYFHAAVIQDERPSGCSRRECLLDSLRRDIEVCEKLRDWLSRCEFILKTSNPFVSAVVKWYRGLESSIQRLEQYLLRDLAFDRDATAAECFSARFVGQGYRTLTLHMVIRMAESLLDRQSENLGQGERADLERILAEAQAFADAWVRELVTEVEWETASIQTLVATQVAAGLLAMQCVEEV